MERMRSPAASCEANGQPESPAYRLVAEQDRNRILEAASRYVHEAPVTITTFPTPRSPGGAHDYYSQADYLWPDPKHPGRPYLARDGQSNPDIFNEHRRCMVALSIQMPALTAAWLLTGERRYADRACDHLRAWFVTPATRMNPNLQFAQSGKGVSQGNSPGIVDSYYHFLKAAKEMKRGISYGIKGSLYQFARAMVGAPLGTSYGIIDTLHLVEVARAASFLTPEMLTSQEGRAVKAWFESYIEWLCHSKPGKQERDADNNHGMCWALQVAEFARFVGDHATRDEIYRRYRNILLPDQLAMDGSFPRELARTKPYSYSIFNFDIVAELCQSLKGLTPDPLTFRLPDGRDLNTAAEFIFPFIEDKSAWKRAPDVEHFHKLPVRSQGLLFSGIAFQKQAYIDLWKTLEPDPTDREVVRNYPIRQPLLWV